LLHHVTLEVAAADVPRFTELLETIGFEPVPVPDSLGAGYRWFERAGTQVHLALVDDPRAPESGHAAFVVDPLAPAVESLERAGFEISERRRHWGSRRVVVAAPSGHRVELMESPPPAPGQAESEG
jgi:catechol 2,3-dioxygenase-like lactoylglutathione lyase family enzyme